MGRLTGGEMDVGEVIDDRFARWGELLRLERATPLFVLGLSQPEDKLVVTAPEELSDEQLLELLGAAAALIRKRVR
jgi:hypothetical protein